MPGLVIGAVLVLLGIHGGREFLSDATDFKLILDLGFLPAHWSVAFGGTSVADVVATASAGDLSDLQSGFARYVFENSGLNPWSLVTYALLHGSWMHVGLNCVWLAAFATPVVRRCGTARALLLAVMTAIGGALAHWLTHPTGVQPMIGASAIVSGLMAGAATFVFDARQGSNVDHFETGGGGARIPLALGRLIRNRTALMFLGVWLVINFASGILARPLGITDAAIAWEAHVGGLLAGLILFPLLDPGPPDWRRWPRGA